MIETGVSPDTCKANMQSLIRGIDHNADSIRRVEQTSTKRLDAHAEDIDDIRDTIHTLAATQQVIAATQEKVVQTQEKLADMQRDHDARIKALEEEKAKPPVTKKWYETDIGRYAVKAGIAVLIVLLAAAIGRGVLADFGSALGLLPK